MWEKVISASFTHRPWRLPVNSSLSRFPWKSSCSLESTRWPRKQAELSKEVHILGPPTPEESDKNFRQRFDYTGEAPLLKKCNEM